jgi:DNA-binding NarL/FixJ family response regulator
MSEIGSSLSVLIADDSSVVRERMTALLEEVPGVAVVGEAVNVAETLEELQRLRPAVLILDLSMPGGSGLDVLRQMGSHPQRPVVIVLTNYSFPEFEREACRYGATAFLNKSTQFIKVADLVRGLADPGKDPAAGREN